MRFLGLAMAGIVGCATGGGTDAGRIDAGGDTPDAGPVSVCGDGIVEIDEECDGAPIGSCEDMGYVGGELACAPTCTLDKSGCLEAACGNGTIDPGEVCDGAELAGASCVSEGFVTGDIACGPDCQLDTGDCDACGNTTVDPGEECDGSPPAGVTCTDLDFLGGTVSCDTTCGIDTSACFDADCGDGVRGGSEDCDRDDHGGRTCANFGFFGGTLGCNSDCTLEFSDCHNCGNGRIEGIEECDGDELDGADCVSRGFTMGTLDCTDRCAYDTSGCSTAACGNGRLEGSEACDDGNGVMNDGCTACVVDGGYSCAGTPSSCRPICGNNMIHGGEECDGSNLAGATCVSRGYSSGTLRCTACAYDETACVLTSCGNGVVDPTEECDDGNTTRFDGCDPTCAVDTSYNLPVRLRNGEGSNHGMVEIFFGGAWRYVCDDTPAASQAGLANVVCRQLGYTGTGHQFITAFGGGSGGPAMDDVLCTGSEATLAQCAFRGWNQHNCAGFEAVGVRCVPAEGDIRLVGGPHGMEGRLQLFHAGAWGEVCDDFFDGAYSAYLGYSTTTVCQQLGYRRGTFLSTYDAPGDVFVVDDVNCTGSERRIGDCPHTAYGTENCSSIEGAGFRCDLFAEGDLRLIAGTARNRGRVEVLHNNVWGTVCDDQLESAGARQTNFVAVGCGQLGFTRAGSPLLYSAVADGVDPVWMDDVNCAGGEATLASCPFGGWAIENCTHSEDIGLSCTP
jgi:cysteine-rich repeat protein